jgi:hypothetical protein
MARKEGSPCQLCDSNIPNVEVSAYNMLPKSQKPHLQVPLDITEEGDVAYSRNREQEKGACEYNDSEEGRHCESGCDQIIPCEIFLEVVPRSLVVLPRQIDGKQGQGIDDLTRTISEKQTLPAYSKA